MYINKFFSRFLIVGVMLAAVSVASATRLPFQPQGSPKMAGIWGRNAVDILQGKNVSARADYTEWTFHADGTVGERGHWLGAVVHWTGFYRLDGDRLSTVVTKYYSDNSWQVGALNAAYTSTVSFPAGGMPDLDLGNAHYWKGLRWNFQKQCYCNGNGNRVWFQGEKQPIAPRGVIPGYMPPLSSTNKLERQINQALNKRWPKSVPFSVTLLDTNPGRKLSYSVTVYTDPFVANRKLAIHWLKQGGFYRPGSKIVVEDFTPADHPGAPAG